MHLGNQQEHAKYFMQDGQDRKEITEVCEEKDLGVLIDNKLKFSQTHTCKCEESKQGLRTNKENIQLHGQNYVSSIIQITSKAALRVWISSMVRHI